MFYKCAFLFYDINLNNTKSYHIHFTQSHFTVKINIITDTVTYLYKTPQLYHQNHIQTRAE